MTAGECGRRTLTGKGDHGRNTEVDGTARAAADGDDMPGAFAAVGDSGGGDDDRQ